MADKSSGKIRCGGTFKTKARNMGNVSRSDWSPKAVVKTGKVSKTKVG